MTSHPSGWTVASERVVYDSPWIRVGQADVTAPDGHRVRDHHTVRLRPAAGVAVVVDDRVLMLWRHRFITRETGWEIPAGKVEDGETPEEAAVRECVEESGWRPDGLEPLAVWTPLDGVADSRFHAFLATGAEQVGAPSDTHEAERIAWVPIAEVARAIDAGEIKDGFTFPALLTVLRRLS
ncbi:MAG TPA: NUDIX hydrolase [Mycobacteriales bacterium]